MGSFFRAIARLIAILCILLFIVTTTLVLPLFAIGRQLLAPQVYKQALAGQDFYQRLPALLGEQLTRQMTYNPCVENPEDPRCQAEGDSGEAPPDAFTRIVLTASGELRTCLAQALSAEAFAAITSGQRPPAADEVQQIRPCLREHGLPAAMVSNEGGPPLYFLLLDGHDWEIIFSELLPAPWFQTQTEAVIDQLFAWLPSDQPALSLMISTREFRENLAGEGGQHMIRQLLAALPPCTPAQLANAGSALARAAEGEVPPCRPPEPLLTQLAGALAKMAHALAAKIPDEYDLAGVRLGGEPEAGTAPPPAAEPGSGPSAEETQRTFRVARAVALFSPLLPGALLLLATLFGVRSWRGWLLWWGTPLLLAGLIGVGMGAALLPAANWAIQTYVAGRIPSFFTPAMAQTGLDIGRSVVQAVGRGIELEGALLGVIGLAMLLGSRLAPGGLSRGQG